jgi:hypothetical protein
MSFLEDRRALYYPYDLEVPGHVTRSILEIRAFLTETIQELDPASPLVIHLKAMRSACRKFLDRKRPMIWRELPFALGELRGIFGTHIAQISAAYKVGISRDLTGILPVADKS